LWAKVCESASERAKGSKSEPTIGASSVVIVAGGGGTDWRAMTWLGERSEPDANEGAKRVREPPCLTSERAERASLAIVSYFRSSLDHLGA